MADTIGVGLIGCGGIALANHYQGLQYCPDTRLVALCDANEATLEHASQQSGIKATYSNYEDLVRDSNVDAVPFMIFWAMPTLLTAYTMACRTRTSANSGRRFWFN